MKNAVTENSDDVPAEPFVESVGVVVGVVLGRLRVGAGTRGVNVTPVAACSLKSSYNGGGRAGYRPWLFDEHLREADAFQPESAAVHLRHGGTDGLEESGDLPKLPVAASGRPLVRDNPSLLSKAARRKLEAVPERPLGEF